MMHAPDYESSYPKELGNISSVVVTDLERGDLKFMMKDIGEKHHNGLLPLMMKTSIGQLGALNTENVVERINSTSKIVIDQRN